MSKSEALEARKQQTEHKAELEKEQRRLQQAFNQQGDLDKGWMREMLDTEDLEEHLDEYEMDKVRALINKQWVLSNLSEAQTHDRWYKLEVMRIKIYGEFPPEESSIQGPVRAFLFDDPKEQLTALSPEQRNIIDQIILSIQNMVARSTDGFERKQINTSIARSESEQETPEKNSGGLGLFS